MPPTPTPQKPPFASPSSPIIALLLPDSAFFAHPQFQPLLIAIGALITQHGYDLALSTPYDDPARFNEFLSSIDGLVFAHHVPAPHVLTAVQTRYMPYTVIDAADTVEQAITELIAALGMRITE